jgi:hypothetical protein
MPGDPSRLTRVDVMSRAPDFSVETGADNGVLPVSAARCRDPDALACGGDPDSLKMAWDPSLPNDFDVSAFDPKPSGRVDVDDSSRRSSGHANGRLIGNQIAYDRQRGEPSHDFPCGGPLSVSCVGAAERNHRYHCCRKQNQRFPHHFDHLLSLLCFPLLALRKDRRCRPRGYSTVSGCRRMLSARCREHPRAEMLTTEAMRGGEQGGKGQCTGRIARGDVAAGGLLGCSDDEYVRLLSSGLVNAGDRGGASF